MAPETHQNLLDESRLARLKRRLIIQARYLTEKARYLHRNARACSRAKPRT